MQVNDPCPGTCLSMNEQLSCGYITPRAQENYVNITILRKYIAGRVAHVQAVDTIILLNLRSVFP